MLWWALPTFCMLARRHSSHLTHAKLLGLRNVLEVRDRADGGHGGQRRSHVAHHAPNLGSSVREGISDVEAPRHRLVFFLHILLSMVSGVAFAVAHLCGLTDGFARTISV